MQSGLLVPSPAACWSIYLSHLHFYIVASSSPLAGTEELHYELEEATGSYHIRSADSGTNERDESQE